MIISRTPLRISFCGGGTDFPKWYTGRYGCVVGAAIDKHIYVMVAPRFEGGVRVAYTQTEIVDDFEDLQHDLIRECMRLTGVTKDVEIATISDVPGRGTGLGSSSAVTVGVLNALWTYERQCRGLHCIEFLGDGQVAPEALWHEEWRDAAVPSVIENNLLLFYLGTTRCADDILKVQDARTDENAFHLEGLSQLARQARHELLAGRFAEVGGLMHGAWLRKMRLADAISTPEIRGGYEQARHAGALGGKVCGAGGGGFMLLYVEPEKQAAVREALSDLKELEFNFDYEGTKILYAD
jgi:D-glycero-alpha-D-manno-heptose-7-phosphate kinase